MKTYSRFQKLLLALPFALLSSVPYGAASAQTTFPISLPDGTQPVAQALTASTDIGAFVKYIGTSACASVAVAAGGDITFTDGPCGAEVATSTFECPVSGPLGGVITVANAACDTIGEVADIVNASSNWRFLPYSMLRADSSNDTLVTIAATQATGVGGLGLAVDNAVALFQTVVVAPPSFNYANLSLGPQSTAFQRKPWGSTYALLTGASTLSTYASGTSLLKVMSVDRTFGATGSEVVTTSWPSSASGATTVAKVFGTCDTPATGCDTAWGQGGLFCLIGQQCLVRLTNSVAMTVNTTAINGFFMLNGGNGLRGVK
jgi:hypothetical protein